MNWEKTLFLHTGWTSHYDGTEIPEGGHAYLREAIGVEAENFKPSGGWCYGYAPVSRTSEGRSLSQIPKASRTLNINKLGAAVHNDQIGGITIIWTARHPFRGPVIVGLYENAVVFRHMPALGNDRPYIAKARVQDSHLVLEQDRHFRVIHKEKGFPGMAAAWFPGLHKDGPAKNFLAAVAEYISTIRISA